MEGLWTYLPKKVWRSSLASFNQTRCASWPRVSPRVGAPRCLAPTSARASIRITSSFTATFSSSSSPSPSSSSPKCQSPHLNSYPSLPSITYNNTAEAHSPIPPSTLPVSLMVPPLSPHIPHRTHTHLAPRPAANYVFGDTASSSLHPEPSSKQIRKILRSPSLDRDLDHHKSTPRSNGISSTSLFSHPPATRTSFHRKPLWRHNACRQ